MKKHFKFRIMWFGILILLLAGVVLSFGTLRQIANADRLLEEKLKNISMMKRSADDLSVYIAAKNAYQRLPGASPVKFEKLFGKSSGIVAENIGSSEESLNDDGWFILRHEVVIDDASLDNVIMTIKKAEAQRPPWKLSSLAVKSSSVAPGHGRVVLLFEALEERM
jgi:hypothetical protein